MSNLTPGGIQSYSKHLTQSWGKKENFKKERKKQALEQYVANIFSSIIKYYNLQHFHYFFIFAIFTRDKFAELKLH